VKALDAQIGAIQSQRSKFAGQVDSLPQTQQEVLRLTRDLQVSQEIYTGLLNNAQQLKVVRGGTVGNVRIIDYAEKPLKPVAPKKSSSIGHVPDTGAHARCGGGIYPSSPEERR